MYLLRQYYLKTSYYLYSLIISVVYVLFLTYVFINILSSFDRYLMSKLTLVMFVYLVINLWFYFSNIYKYSSYTTAIQRFWKRTFMLFWIIEGFLFSIFIFFYINCSDTVAFFMDTNVRKDNYLTYDYNNYIYAYTIVVLYSFCCLYLKKNWTHLLIVFNVAVTIIIVYLFINEFFKFIETLNTLYSNKNNLFSTSKIHSNSIGGSMSVLTASEYTSIIDNRCDVIFKKRVKNQYVYLINILKFWHILLILLLYYLQVNKLFLTKKNSYDVISSANQNLIYMYLFNVIGILFTLKPIFVLNYKVVYFWFFENPNITSGNYIIELINILYT